MVKGKCVTKYCRNKASDNRKVCHKCKKTNDKNRDPVGYAYRVLKNNAKRRNKIFTITLRYFRDFCAGSEYMQRKGREGDCLSIDRKEVSKGYEPGNLQILTVSKNTRKGNFEYGRYKGESLPDDVLDDFSEDEDAVVDMGSVRVSDAEDQF